jgi:hypothetical protein
VNGLARCFWFQVRRYRQCREADCEHLDLRSELFGDVHEEVGYRAYYEVWTCRDCGARIDEDGEVINRRAA